MQCQDVKNIVKCFFFLVEMLFVLFWVFLNENISQFVCIKYMSLNTHSDIYMKIFLVETTRPCALWPSVVSEPELIVSAITNHPACCHMSHCLTFFFSSMLRVEGG